VPTGKPGINTTKSPEKARRFSTRVTKTGRKGKGKTKLTGAEEGQTRFRDKERKSLKWKKPPHPSTNRTRERKKKNVSTHNEPPSRKKKPPGDHLNEVFPEGNSRRMEAEGKGEKDKAARTSWVRKIKKKTQGKTVDKNPSPNPTE